MSAFIDTYWLYWLTPIAALFIAATTAPFGCLLVWRRMAYFGDALAHTALLGVALGIIFSLNIYIGAALICALFATLLVWLQSRQNLSVDTILGILAHGGLALGILVFGLFGAHMMEDTEHNGHDAHGEHDMHNESEGIAGHDNIHMLEAYLFGDLSALTLTGFATAIIGCLLVVIILRHFWQPLILMTLSEDLARAEGVDTLRLHYIIMGLMTLIVALAMKIAGVLFITSLLIIPAATARQLSRTPRQMASLAVLFALIAVSGGFGLTQQADIPLGASIAGCLSLLFVLSLFIARLIRQRNIKL